MFCYRIRLDYYRTVRYLDGPLDASYDAPKHSTFEGIMTTLNQVVHQLQARRRLTEQELEKLNLAIKALTGGTARLGRPPGQRSKPKFSKAGLARIAAAQRKRWAKIKAAQKK
jgi:hypothetical protein